jgi:formate dehydrogenase major subunit
MAPVRLGPGRFVHQIGIPYHFGYEGEVRGDSANDLPPLVADPNVTIHEGKAFTGNIRAGRRHAFTAGTPEVASVPESEQTPFGNPEHPGPVAGPGARGGTVETAIVSPAEVMEAARVVHRLEERSTPARQ